jgi:mannose-6-phosphate isomerase-like protein (cupin superfamily)
MPGSTQAGAPSSPSGPAMPDVRRVDEELGRLASDRRDFTEIFRSPSGSLSLTVLRRPAGSVDDQEPHTEDEVYYLIKGRAGLAIGDERVDLVPGSVAFVAAGVEHHFVDVAEDLEVLVFWSPARHTGGR